MSIITDQPVTRSWFFSDIWTGDVFWLSADRRNPQSCKAKFRRLNADGKSRDFECVNGEWMGTLTEQEKGALELHIHETGDRKFVHICELVERSQPKTDKEILL